MNLQDNFINSRVCDIEESLVQKNEYMLERDNERKNLESLEKVLSDDEKMILSGALDARNAQAVIVNEVCYCKGFSDCIKVIAYGKLD